MTNRSDNFTGTDFSNLNGRTPSGGGSAWQVLSRSWQISANRAVSQAGGSTPGIALLNSDTSNVEVSAAVSNLNSTTVAGIAARSSSTNLDCLRFAWVDFGSPAFYITSFVAGVETQIATPVAGSLANGDILTFVLNGTSLEGKKNGVTVISTTSSTHLLNTRHGLMTFGDTSLTFYDDFSITDLSGPTGPTINTQPANASVTAPTAATFTAAATSSGGTLLRQWFRRTGGTGDGAEVTSGTGGTTDSYNTGTTAVSGGNANNGDQYRCRYRDDNGDTFTNWVTLTVTVPLATAAPISCPEHASQPGFSGVVLSAAAPGAGVTVLQTFTGLSLNGSGAANVSVSGLGQAVGAVRYVIGTQSDGNLAPGTNPRCFQGPVALT